MSQGPRDDPESLLMLARGGQTEALGDLLEIYRSWLLLVSRLQIDRRLQGKVSASDLVQETFLHAQRAFPGFQGTTERELVEWLRRILASRLAEVVRRYFGTKRRNARLEQELEAELDQSSQIAPALVDSGASPSQQAAERERVVLVANALDRLSKDYREVIILRHFQGLPFSEVALRMNCSEEAIKKTWARALSALRRALGGMQSEV